ncbi:hypothetical protein [Blastococcus sp. TF02A-35]|uniref:hypothetical protein n=1 Tax=Blastococcus sp. TF02A-35 TaxID=2559612 RepID=UPI001073FA61|nr:hypothetical protein [Blastococcus sp. TF02A_35]TFV53537.1 hypothetical protein E4P43_01195 [Blastococcus sp. TF02A_35]
MTERQQDPATTEISAVQGPGGATAPPWSTERAVFRRSDPVAGLLLLLAGAAAGVSLLLPWLADDDATGLDLVRRGFGGLGDVVDTGLWQPLVIVLGGALLLVAGVLVFLPARTHRPWGVLALVVSGLVVWAVLVPLVAAGFDLGFFDAGFWCAIAVAVLGLLGAAKALLSPPRTG